MSRINTNVSSLISARILNTNTDALNTSLERLSTGLRINRGADDPAGLIASENLRKQIKGTESAIKNGERAINIVGTAEGSLQEINSMLLDMQGLLSEAANTGGMSAEEIDANQLQVDSILNSVNRIANTTEFEGIKLLNGGLAYTTNGVGTSQIAELNINAAKLIDGATMTVAITQTASAQTGLMRLSSTGTKLSADLTIQIGTGRGTTELTFAQSTTLTKVMSGINAVKEITGISAALSANGSVKMMSVDFGSDAYVSVKILNFGAAVGTKLYTGTGVTATTDSRDAGQDVAATVNGTAATGSGKKLTIRTAMLDAEIDLTAKQAKNKTSSFSFTITGGGADFALGPVVDANGLESIGIQNISTASLGNSTDGYLSTLKSGGTNALSGDNLYTAQRIVSAAIKDVSTLRGRLGAFQKNTLETTINSLNVTNENLTAAESAIRDTDFATETSKLTRAQILVQASTSVLSQANYAPQSVLSLLK
jgi:flagellin